MIVRTLAIAVALAACSGGATGELGPDASSGSPADARDPDAAAPEPDFTSLPWTTIGTGIEFNKSHGRISLRPAHAARRDVDELCPDVELIGPIRCCPAVHRRA